MRRWLSPRRPVDNNIEHVPPSELKIILLKIVEAGLGIPRPDLVVEAARALGFARTGGRITEFVDELVQQLLDDGPLLESFGMLRLADKQ